jgi:hypothetical protein
MLKYVKTPYFDEMYKQVKNINKNITIHTIVEFVFLK